MGDEVEWLHEHSGTRPGCRAVRAWSSTSASVGRSERSASSVGGELSVASGASVFRGVTQVLRLLGKRWRRVFHQREVWRGIGADADDRVDAVVGWEAVIGME